MYTLPAEQSCSANTSRPASFMRAGFAPSLGASQAGASSRSVSESAPSPARSLRSQKLSPSSKRRAASSQSAMVPASPPGMNWKQTSTAPPQIMPRFSTSSRVRAKSWRCEARSARHFAAICSLRYSTAPPPMVPYTRPSAPTSIRAPAPRGVAPDEATTLTRTMSSFARRRSARSLSSFFILLLPFRQPIFSDSGRPHSAAPWPARPPACRFSARWPQSAAPACSAACL